MFVLKKAGIRGNILSDKSRTVDALLCFFLGVFGAHRFYEGKTGTAILMLCLGWATLGIWPLIDLILIFAGKATDKDGLPIREW
jgi:TM2 domain-containing membrane protein YozV